MHDDDIICADVTHYILPDRMILITCAAVTKPSSQIYESDLLQYRLQAVAADHEGQFYSAQSFLSDEYLGSARP